MSAAPFATGETPGNTILAFSLTYYWDAGGLEWVEGTQPGGGGGGGAVTIADGADVAEGATADAAVVTDTTGTVSGKLRGLVKWAFERMPASLGQKAMAASLPVVIASDQSAVPVSGTVAVTGALTDAELRATPVPVSGTVAVTGSEVTAAVANTTNQVWGNGDPVPLSADLAGNLRVGARDSVRLDEASATITYVGMAPPGTLTSAASWAIKRLDSTSGLIVLWADGDPQSDNIWDDRAALSYS